MPRHSPILQILVYFYSKQEKCNIYSYIFIYILKPRHQKKKKGKKQNNIHIATTAFRETLEANLEKNTRLFKTHIHTNIILPLYLFQYCKLI